LEEVKTAVKIIKGGKAPEEDIIIPEVLTK